MKPAIVAKLSSQTAIFYGVVRECCNKQSLSTIIDPSWGHHADFQQKCFLSAAEYWQSQASKEVAIQKGTGYGEEIVRLSRAERIIRDGLAFAIAKQLSPALQASGEALLRTVIAAKGQANSDNHTIYMEPLPSEGTLDAVGGVAMVKASDMMEFSITENDLLLDIVPKAVRLLRGSMRARLDGILSQVTNDAAAASSQGRAALSTVGLPSSLEAYKSGDELPESLWLKIQRVQSLGGKAGLETKFEVGMNSNGWGIFSHPFHPGGKCSRSSVTAIDCNN